MRLETDRLIIRSMELEDKNAFMEIATNGGLHDIFGEYEGYPKWLGNWIKEGIQLDKENNPYNQNLSYAIIEKKANRVIGSVGCSYYEDLGQIGIVYFIDNMSRRKGYASESVIAYAKYFLESYDVSEIIANIRTENVASCRTVEKSGFILKETKMYKDIYDKKENEYNFYELKKFK